MTSKQLRVLLVAGLMLLLCGGCFGNCVTDIFDGLGSAMSGDYRGSYHYVIEADGGLSDLAADAGIE